MVIVHGSALSQSLRVGSMSPPHLSQRAQGRLFSEGGFSPQCWQLQVTVGNGIGGREQVPRTSERVFPHTRGLFSLLNKKNPGQPPSEDFCHSYYNVTWTHVTLGINMHLELLHRREVTARF